MSLRSEYAVGMRQSHLRSSVAAGGLEPSQDYGVQGRKIMKRMLVLLAVTAVAAAGVLTVLSLGSVAAAHASTPVSRANAVRQAKNYLQFEAFSFKGLVEQLKFEGYSASDATYGASHSGANWMKEAVAKAREYLKLQPFSRSGLIGQLEFEGFTLSQAMYGVRAVGL